MSKESRLGLFAVVVLGLAIWGYKYLKGQNLLSKSYTFKSVYEDVNQLTISSPVLFNGLIVGSVTSIKPFPDDIAKMIVTYDIEKDFKIPKDAIAYQISNGVINGKAISLKFSTLCNGANCAESGDFLKGKNLGLIGSMIGKEEVGDYLKEVTSELNTVISKVGSPESEGAINETIRQLQKSMENIESLTRTTDALVKSSYKNLNQTLENMNVITSNLAANNGQITGMLNNLNTITADVKNANIGNTISSSNATIQEAKVAMESLQTTLSSADEAIKSLDNVLGKVNEGDGTLGKLLNNDELYSNLELTSKNLSLLLQDLRLNPKRYVNVSIFGKKNKDYVKPEADPAFIEN